MAKIKLWPVLVWYWLMMPCAISHAVQTESVKKERQPSPIVRLGKIETKKIDESSGLCLSSTVKKSFWTINDSGNAEEMYLLSFEGELLSTVVLSGSKNKDWEAMTAARIDGLRYLVVGDVGDNNLRRKDLELYLVKEPDGTSQKAKSNTKRLKFKFEGGPANCEAMAYEPLSKTLWFVEKRYVGDKRKGSPGVFELDISNLNNGSVRTAQRIGDFPIRNVTGMAFSEDGQRLIIRNYVNAHLYTKAEDKSWTESFRNQRPTTVVLPIQRQGEAICFAPDGRSVIITSEQKKQAIWKINLPAEPQQNAKK